MTGPVVVTAAGAVRGVPARRGATVFRGIPYAAAPVGKLRFEGPTPVEPWTGIRDASHNAPTPLRAVPNAAGRVPLHTIAGDDVLNLTVFSANLPSEETSALQPVLVWIHGGAYHEGSAADPLWDLSDFAADGVVGVAINYRVGFDGYGYVPGATQNRGVLDWIAALEWVRDNIAAFGGDLDRVTIAGHSSGASAVLRLLTIEAAHPLFARAIAQSPAELDISLANALAITDDLAVHLGVSADRAGFETLSVDVVQQAQYRPLDAATGSAGGSASVGSSASVGWVLAAGVGTTLRYMPIIDGDLITASMIEASRAGVGATIPLLIGAVAHELDAPAVFVEESDRLGGTAVLSEALGAEAASRYIALLPDGLTGAQQVAQFISDRIFRRPAPRFAESRPVGSTWVYEFAYPDATRTNDRVFHGDELKYLFGAPEVRGSAISERLRADWIGFISASNPGWEPCSVAAHGRRYGVVDVAAAVFARERELFLKG
jgi:para-nitrobenzyl esterase